MPCSSPTLRRAAVAASLVLAATGAGSQPAATAETLNDKRVFATGPERDDPRYVWAALTPPMLLDVLRRHPGQTMWLFMSPPGWITAPDLVRLQGMIGSEEPTAVTCPLVAAHSPPAGASSTVGREARNMTRAAGRGWSWPLGCSDL